MRRLIVDERGSATVVGAWVIGALVALVVLTLYVGAAVIARHRAQSAADLAALGAAIAHLSGDDACARAESVAERQRVGVRVVRCVVVDDDVTLTVALDVALGRWGIREARASARAGPVDSR